MLIVMEELVDEGYIGCAVKNTKALLMECRCGK
jgi:hypothetical protein